MTENVFCKEGRIDGFRLYVICRKDKTFPESLQQMK